MKRIVNLLSACSLAVVLGIPCFALGTFSDSLSGSADSDAVVYSGAYCFEQGLFSDIGWNAPDQDGLLLIQNSSAAAATYRVSGADSISFSFYSPFAPFAAPDNAQSGQYSIGYEHSSAVTGGTFQIADASRLYYCQSSQEIFFTNNGSWYRVIYDQSEYCYRAQPVYGPSGSLDSLFCNLYASSDGENFSPVDYRITGVRCAVQDGASMAFCYQNATASLPSDTAYVRLELTSCGQVPDENGYRLEYDRAAGVALAQVNFTGSNLVVGTAPSNPSDLPASSNSSKKEPSSEKESSSKNSSKKSSSSNTRNSFSKSASSKYDGTGVMMQKGSSNVSIAEQNQENAGSVEQNQDPASLIETQIGISRREQNAWFGYVYMAIFAAVLLGIAIYLFYRKKHLKNNETEKEKEPQPKA